jgi:hypothetical protein
VDSTSTLESAEQRDATNSSPDDVTVTTELTTPLAAAGDSCPNCGARMATDQRYCVECGERRTGGGLRDALPRTQTTTVAAAAAPAWRPRMSANSNLIAGIATLLIAMGVGVLIGRSGDHSNKSANTPVQVVTVPAGGAAATTATGAAGSTATPGASTTSKSKKSTKAPKQTASQQTAAKAHVKLPPPVVKVGGKCAKGAKGCQGGKFTGGFFGG